MARRENRQPSGRRKAGSFQIADGRALEKRKGDTQKKLLRRQANAVRKSFSVSFKYSVLFIFFLFHPDFRRPGVAYEAFSPRQIGYQRGNSKHPFF